MPRTLRPLALACALAFAALVPAAPAGAETLEVTVSYRERIALPPDAELEVQLLDPARADRATGRIASQRFAMEAVPMTVGLAYDPGVVDPAGSYAVVASIWSGERRVFRTSGRHDAFGPGGAGPVEIVLTMVPGEERGMVPPRSVQGIAWAVTEIAGEPWSTDDPATLTIDEEMNVALFGGCNRFRGEATLADGEIAFPPEFAGTLMACPDPVEALELRFLEALTRVSGYVRYGAGLVMTDAGGNALLHFVERPE